MRVLPFLGFPEMFRTGLPALSFNCYYKKASFTYPQILHDGKWIRKPGGGWWWWAVPRQHFFLDTLKEDKSTKSSAVLSYPSEKSHGIFLQPKSYSWFAMKKLKRRVKSSHSSPIKSIVIHLTTTFHSTWVLHQENVPRFSEYKPMTRD